MKQIKLELINNGYGKFTQKSHRGSKLSAEPSKIGLQQVETWGWCSDAVTYLNDIVEAKKLMTEFGTSK